MTMPKLEFDISMDESNAADFMIAERLKTEVWT